MSQTQEATLNQDNRNIEDFGLSGGLTLLKLRTYIPSMLMTNISNLLLISVDGLVVGNFAGKDALASVNIFGPVTMMIGAMTVLAACGIGTSLSTAMGTNRQNEIDRVRSTSLRLMIAVAIIASVIQIPFVTLIINSYRLSSEMSAMVWQYAIGLMICTPLGIVSTVGVYQLQIAGRMKALMWLAIAEGGANLIFDLLFVGVFDMGVRGAGLGTACSNFIRASLTVIYLARRTDIYKRTGYKPEKNDYIEILRCGMPDAAYQMVIAFQSYFIMKILLSAFGTDGGVINGVTTFCFSITNVIISAIQGSMRPLVGLLTGAEDHKGLSKLMKQGFRLNIISAGICTVIVELFPRLFFILHGVRDIPEYGMLSVRIFALYFIIKGMDALLRLYLTNRRDSHFATGMTVAGAVVLPLISFALSKILPPPYIWAAYPITECLMFSLFYRRFRWWVEKDKEADHNSGEEITLYMSVSPADAVSASRALRRFADEHGINESIAYRVSLCMEEMVSYIMETGGREAVQAQIIIRFTGKNKAVFTVIDDGREIKFIQDEGQRALTTNNYELMKRLAKSVDYQYILNLNYTTLKFEARKQMNE